jgi:hypothetical protein
MKYRKLTADGDYTTGTGADFWVNVPDAVAQAVNTRLDLLKGEWFLDTADGTPWFQDVLGKYTQNQYDAVIKQRIRETEGVSSILSFASAYDGGTRTLVQNVSIATIYGVAYINRSI